MSLPSHWTRREFLHHSVSAAAGMVALPALGTTASTVPAQRLDKLRTGTNVCLWFRGGRQESDDHLRNYIQDEEAAWMARMGLLHVRLCVTPRVIMDRDSGSPREDRAKLLEQAIERFHRAGLLVMVDIHNEDRAAELNPAWQEAFVRFWAALASRLRRFDPDLTMLEIINEPVFDKREKEWDVLNEKLAAVIREKAPDHTIVTSGPNWGGIDGLKKITPLKMANVVYSFHCYDPFPFTHQGATWSSDNVKPLRGVPYPSSPEAVASLLPSLAAHPQAQSTVEKYGREQWNKARLARRFQEGIAWGEKYQAPLYCGEFGVFPPFAKPEHRANWFRDFGEVLAENKIGWAVWGWDEGFGLNRRKVDGRAMVDPVVVQALGLKLV